MAWIDENIDVAEYKSPMQAMGTIMKHFGKLADGNMVKGLLQEGGLSKAVIGYLNRKLNPKRAFLASMREKIFAYLEREEWDFLVISGDLTNFSHPEEFKMAYQALQPLEKKGTICLVPGNHDRYISAANGLVEEFFSSIYPTPANPCPIAGVQEIALDEGWRMVLLDQATPRAIYSSQGKSQFDSSALLEYSKNLQEKKIFVGHYPAFLPEGEVEAKMHQIQGREAFRNFLLEADAKAYLHGHIHKSWDFTHQEGEGSESLQVLNAGGCCKYAEGEHAGFYRIELGESFTYQKITL